MNRPDDDTSRDKALDRAAHVIRGQQMSDAEIAAAAERVLARVGLDGSRPFDCASFRAMIPDSLAGTLPESKRLLLEAHAADCVACRHARRDARTGGAAVGRPVQARSAKARRGRGPLRWVAAAAAAAAVLGFCAYVVERGGLGAGSRMATINVIDGRLFEVAATGLSPLRPAKKISYGTPLRTGPGGSAVVELHDGTRIEMRERSELTLRARGRDTDIKLDRGSVIVEAAKQKDGHLFVTTNDCEVAVVGTVFAVNAGTRGSRVSVLEGEVHVERASTETVLRPGDQFSSSPALGVSPLADEVAWSREREKHMAVIAELAGLRAEIAALPGPAARTSTHLFDLMPARTMAYAGIPNIADTVDGAHQLFLQHLQSSAGFREWWAQTGGPEGSRRLEDAVAKIKRLGGLLGDEIAVGIIRGFGDSDGSHDAGILVLADVRDAAGLRGAIETELAAAGAHDGLRFVDRLPAPPSHREELTVFLDTNLLMASNDPSLLNSVAARRTGEAAGIAAAGDRLAATPFGRRMAQAYAEGAVWLGGVNLEDVFAEAGKKGDAPQLEKLGISGARFLVLEAKGAGDNALRKGTVDFAAPRTGLASWLAEPAPMGALEFVTPDASVAAAAVLKDPAAMLDDILGTFSSNDALSGMREHIGVDLREDLLAALGGEMALALDGPLLPVPAVKIVVEVYDAGRVQRAFETLVARAAAELPPERQLELVREESGGRTWYSLQTRQGASFAAYTFVDGYLLLGTQRPLLERAISNRANGLTLLTSPTFLGLLPRDRDANMSALAYRGGGQAIEALGGALGGLFKQMVPGGADAEPLGLGGALAASSGPALIYAYGEPQRISVGVSGGDSGTIGLSLLLGLAQQGHLGAAHTPDAAPAPAPSAPDPARHAPDVVL